MISQAAKSSAIACLQYQCTVSLKVCTILLKLISKFNLDLRLFIVTSSWMVKIITLTAYVVRLAFVNKIPSEIFLEGDIGGILLP